VNACKAGGHTFSIMGFGTGNGGYDQLPLDAQDSYQRQVNSDTRLIWGANAKQRKDYDGVIASMDGTASNDDYSGLWSYMGGTNSGSGMARAYFHMAQQLQGTEIRVAPLIFLSDMTSYDVDVRHTMRGSFPVISGREIDQSGPTDRRSDGFWYWAKKYHDDFGPVIMFQMNSPGDRQSPDYIERIQQAFIQYIGGGQSSYRNCFMSSVVKMDASGGNLREVAKDANNFIKNMNGQGDVQCGGKGVTF